MFLLEIALLSTLRNLPPAAIASIAPLRVLATARALTERAARAANRLPGKFNLVLAVRALQPRTPDWLVPLIALNRLVSAHPVGRSEAGRGEAANGSACRASPTTAICRDGDVRRPL